MVDANKTLFHDVWENLRDRSMADESFHGFYEEEASTQAGGDEESEFIVNLKCTPCLPNDAS